ncbi:MAG TPA: hypothetical protein VGI75_13750 [Pirellulales bacterium]|jgi:hypothetical protein
MTLRLAVVFCALGIASMAKAGDLERVKLSDIPAGSFFEFTTADHVYQGLLVDPSTGEVQLKASKDGQQFTAPRTMFLLGATQGRQADANGIMLVKMNQLQTGMSIELGVGSLDQRDRQMTEPVRSIRVE